MELILASGSPRRKELLALITPEFTVHTSDVDESTISASAPELLVQKLAQALNCTMEDMMKLSSPYDEKGLPKDRSYLECGLPEFLQESIQAMVKAWQKVDNGEDYTLWDCDYCNLQSDINSAEVNQIISPEQAWYLREKYLRMERE